MTKALHLKYRPQNFDELVGQNPIKITLVNEIEQGRVAHAYLFSGPRGIGKTTTARLLARAVNCTDRKGAEPCSKCQFCQAMQEGRALDMIEIDAASHTGVDNVRENIIENARFTPQSAKYKVFIIDEVHMLSVSAFNALLKTLEEPPEHVIFILATTEIHRVPETIISRCQRFDFKRVSVDELVNRLQYIAKQEKIKISDSILNEIARRSEGSVRDAEVLMSQLLALNEKEISEETASLVIPRSEIGTLFELFDLIVHRNITASLALVNKLIEEGVHLNDFIKEFVEFLRQALLIRVGGGTPDKSNVFGFDDQLKKKITKTLELVSVKELLAIIEKFIAVTHQLKYSQIIQLPIELAIIELCGDAGSKEIVEESNDEDKDNDNASSGSKPAGKADSEPVANSKIEKISKGILKFEDIQRYWPQFIDKLRDRNQSLGLTLKIGAPIKIKGNILTIGFCYKFHADRVKEREIKNIISEVFQEVTGQKIEIKADVVSEKEIEGKLGKVAKNNPDSKKGEAWGQALQFFGGEVVEEEL